MDPGHAPNPERDRLKAEVSASDRGSTRPARRVAAVMLRSDACGFLVQRQTALRAGEPKSQQPSLIDQRIDQRGGMGESSADRLSFLVQPHRPVQVPGVAENQRLVTQAGLQACWVVESSADPRAPSPRSSTSERLP
jgi:hypothetical protein